MVQLTGHAAGLTVEGWGECAALADHTYDAEDALGALSALEELLVPALVARAAPSGGLVPPPSLLGDLGRTAPGAPLAFAALEMAIADAHLRAEARSLAQTLDVAGRAVPIGAVVGQFDSADALVAEVSRFAEQGFTRVKVKIGPGWDLEPLEAVTGALPGMRLQADANGAYRASDLDHLGGIDRFGLLCLEQPFDRADLDSHRQLARRISTPICLDESIDSPESARQALASGACSVVCVKPARLGGLGAALDLVESCTDSGTPLWVGGMFESGYARGVNTALAALPGFSWPGDLSPAATYLEHDVSSGSEQPFLDAGGVLCILPPPGPGMGAPPDPGLMARFGQIRRHFEPSQG
jgi:O-succinylbenzoate synthase